MLLKSWRKKKKSLNLTNSVSSSVKWSQQDNFFTGLLRASTRYQAKVYFRHQPSILLCLLSCLSPLSLVPSILWAPWGGCFGKDRWEVGKKRQKEGKSLLKLHSDPYLKGFCSDSFIKTVEFISSLSTTAQENKMWEVLPMRVETGICAHLCPTALFNTPEPPKGSAAGWVPGPCMAWGWGEVSKGTQKKLESHTAHSQAAGRACKAHWSKTGNSPCNEEITRPRLRGKQEHIKSTSTPKSRQQDTQGNCLNQQRTFSKLYQAVELGCQHLRIPQRCSKEGESGRRGKALFKRQLSPCVTHTQTSQSTQYLQALQYQFSSSDQKKLIFQEYALSTKLNAITINETPWILQFSMNEEF